MEITHQNYVIFVSAMLPCKGTASPPSSRPPSPPGPHTGRSLSPEQPGPSPGQSPPGCRPSFHSLRSQAPGLQGRCRAQVAVSGDKRAEPCREGSEAGLVSALDLTRQPSGRTKHAHRHGTRTPQNTGHVAARCITEASSREMPVRRADLG